MNTTINNEWVCPSTPNHIDPSNEIRFLTEAVLESLQNGTVYGPTHQARVDLLAIISILEHEL